MNEFTLRPAPGSPWTSTFLFDNLRLVDAACVPVGVAEATEAAWSAHAVAPGVVKVQGATGQLLRVFDVTGRLRAEVRATAEVVTLEGLGSGLCIVVLESGESRSVWVP